MSVTVAADSEMLVTHRLKMMTVLLEGPRSSSFLVPVGQVAT